MTKTSLVCHALIIAAAASLVPAWAYAETKAPKPTVCRDYTFIWASKPAKKDADGNPTADYALCKDGKRPRVFTEWTEVQFQGQNFLVGR